MAANSQVASLPRSSQGTFWKDALIFHHSIVEKLLSINRDDLVASLQLCSTAEIALTCRNCFITKFVSNRCEKRWCPLCVPRLARERRDALEFWSATLKQPKHVVVTSRNTDDLTKRHVRRFVKALYRLRKQTFSENWLAGTWALEVTNESRGWHLHGHLLVEADWIDSGKLAKVWGRLVGQDFAIVKVKDARKADYLRELLKYVVKSSQLAGWKPAEIADFMDAFNRTRTFGVFGSLVGQRSEWKKLLKELKRERARCACGECNYEVEDSRIWQLNEGDKRKLRSHH